MYMFAVQIVVFCCTDCYMFVVQTATCSLYRLLCSLYRLPYVHCTNIIVVFVVQTAMCLLYRLLRRYMFTVQIVIFPYTDCRVYPLDRLLTLSCGVK